ncbi:YbaB/EbfC family nucleoid-associated protein [Mycobacterium simiae]|uniref:YbaB/EbfC family nucleoid-associated protein n=1 Tax=Mycobacterium simiae TaxID=1784 RepID=A0A5B1BX59_MYCSI|nr:YbaB/EbfC family nucleoid-associated protein [Mycobacterium simiae]KAA1251744.1 YbaB/EbfC family nucleoid-associated protein [Mycobacterium simiae]
MNNEIHPQAAEVLKQLQEVNSALEGQMGRANTASYAGTDEAMTVGVTLDAQRTLTGLHIEDGLLRLGVETVAQRINEALTNAQAAASACIRAQQEQLAASLTDITASLVRVLRPG